MHSVAHEVKVEWYRWIASLDLRLPSKLHVWHHALTSLDQRQRLILNSCGWLDNYFLVLICSRVVVLLLFALGRLLLVN